MLVAVAMAVLLVKPWAADPAGPGAGTAGGDVNRGDRVADSPVSTTPAPTDPYAELVVTCGKPSGWRVATLQTWIGRAAPIRTWLAADPVPAGGPADPRIQAVPVATDLVLAMGYCSPVGPDQPPQGITVEIWSVPDGAAPVLLHARRFEPIHAHPLGGLWLPTEDRSVTMDGMAGWAPGRYAIRLGARSYERWLGVEIEDLSIGRQPSPSPSPTPTPTPTPQT